MKLEDAIKYWVTESGYRQIQTLLSKNIHGKSKYAMTNLLESPNNITEIKKAREAIKTLRSAMEPGTKQETFWRGSPSEITESHKREGFFAVTRDKKKAEAYGDVFQIMVDKNVPRISFSAEGDETLIMNGMIYTYDIPHKKIFVRSPNNSNIALPYLGNLYTVRKTAKNKEVAERAEYLIELLYKCSFEERNDELGYLGMCPELSETGEKEFNKKSFDVRYKLLAERLKLLKESGTLDEFLENIPLHNKKWKTEVEQIVKNTFEFNGLSAGRRITKRLKRRKTRKNTTCSL